MKLLFDFIPYTEDEHYEHKLCFALSFYEKLCMSRFCVECLSVYCFKQVQ